MDDSEVVIIVEYTTVEMTITEPADVTVETASREITSPVTKRRSCVCERVPLAVELATAADDATDDTLFSGISNRMALGRGLSGVMAVRFD